MKIILFVICAILLSVSGFRIRQAADAATDIQEGIQDLTQSVTDSTQALTDAGAATVNAVTTAAAPFVGILTGNATPAAMPAAAPAPAPAPAPAADDDAARLQQTPEDVMNDIGAVTGDYVTATDEFLQSGEDALGTLQHPNSLSIFLLFFSVSFGMIYKYTLNKSMYLIIYFRCNN